MLSAFGSDSTRFIDLWSVMHQPHLTKEAVRNFFKELLASIKSREVNLSVLDHKSSRGITRSPAISYDYHRREWNTRYARACWWVAAPRQLAAKGLRIKRKILLQRGRRRRRRDATQQRLGLHPYYAYTWRRSRLRKRYAWRSPASESFKDSRFLPSVGEPVRAGYGRVLTEAAKWKKKISIIRKSAPSINLEKSVSNSIWGATVECRNFTKNAFRQLRCHYSIRWGVFPEV